MPESGSLIIIHLVEKQDVGYRFLRNRGEWPLHITLIPWFSAPDEMVLRERLALCAASAEEFELTVGTGEFFGTHNDVAVNVIANQQSVLYLHNALAATLSEIPVSFHETHWMGKNYKAHITHHGSKRRNEGDVELVDDFHLVRLLDDDVCEVAGQFTMKKVAS